MADDLDMEKFKNNLGYYFNNELTFFILILARINIRYAMVIDYIYY